MNKKKSKLIIAILVTLAMVFTLMPATSLATTTTPDTVKVSVENNTLTDGTEPWKGELFTTNVKYTSGMTVLEALQSACKAKGKQLVTTSSDYGTYVSSINGLDQNYSTYAGWTFAENDWFTNGSSADVLEAGDEVSFYYTVTWRDVGGDYGDNTKSLKGLKVSQGTLSSEFNSTTKNYTLTVASGTKGIVITPTATNKNFQVRTSVGSKVYKRSATVPIKEGTKITVKCGNPDWPSMNNPTAKNVAAESYAITVNVSMITPSAKAKSISYNTNKIQWKKVSGAKGYVLYRATSKTGKYTKVKTKKTTYYKDTKVKTGKVYYYKVRAYKYRNGKKAYSKVSKATSVKTIPATPKLKLNSKSKKHMTATWTKVTGAQGYVLYRASSKKGTFKKIKIAKGSWNRDYTNSTLKSGKTYCYKVRAYTKVDKQKVYGRCSAVVVKKVK